MMMYAKRNVGQNRGKRRLWIEGKLLIEAGFTHGKRWDLVETTFGFKLIENPDGKRKVSGKPDRPIIDISGSTLDLLPDATVFGLSYAPDGGFINVTQHYPEEV